MKVTARNHGVWVIGIVILLALACAMSACSKRPTTISGILLFTQGQLCQDATVVAVLEGAEVSEAPVDPTSGRFLITLPRAGTYSLRLKHPKITPVDFFVDIPVKKGNQVVTDPYPAPPEILASYQTTNEASIVDSAHVTQETKVVPLATIKGTVHPQGATIRVLNGDRVVAEGQAKGSMFEIASVPVGTYDIEYSAQGFATIYHRKVTVSTGGAGRELNAYLLFMSAIDGVNWQKGVAVATGQGQANPTVPRNQATQMACQSARAKAYRDMTDTIIQIQVEPGRPITSLSSGEGMKFKVEGFIQSAGAISETKNKDGSCEVTLQIPLQGPGSVVNFIQKKIGREH